MLKFKRKTNIVTQFVSNGAIFQLTYPLHFCENVIRFCPSPGLYIFNNFWIANVSTGFNFKMPQSWKATFFLQSSSQIMIIVQEDLSIIPDTKQLRCWKPLLELLSALVCSRQTGLADLFSLKWCQVHFCFRPWACHVWDGANKILPWNRVAPTFVLLETVPGKKRWPFYSRTTKIKIKLENRLKKN